MAYILFRFQRVDYSKMEQKLFGFWMVFRLRCSVFKPPLYWTIFHPFLQFWNPKGVVPQVLKQVVNLSFLFVSGIQLDASPKPDFAPKSFFLRTVRDKQHQLPEVFHTTLRQEHVAVPKYEKSQTGYNQISPPWKLSSRVDEDKTGIVHLSVNSVHSNGSTDHFQLPFR